MSGKPRIDRRDPFRALADRTRRGILELLLKRQNCSAGEISGGFPGISRPAVSRHLRVLREARLVKAKGIGREHRYRLDSGALARLQRDWFSQFTTIWEASLVALKKQVESDVAQSRDTRRRSGSARRK